MLDNPRDYAVETCSRGRGRDVGEGGGQQEANGGMFTLVRLPRNLKTSKEKKSSVVRHERKQSRPRNRVIHRQE